MQGALRVGLLTYDHRVHLYNLSPSLSRPHMLVVTETDELELPLTEGLLVPLSEAKHIIQRSGPSRAARPTFKAQ